MGIEIERKFLVEEKFNPYDLSPDREIDIKQGYINLEKERLVRIRICNDNRAILSIKGKKTKLTRYEFEYTIPTHEGEELISKIALEPIIKKKRYVINYKGYEWEIDVFQEENNGLILVEVELDREDENFKTPQFITREVTGNPRYYNYNLVKNPYKNWKTEGASENGTKKRSD